MYEYKFVLVKNLKYPQLFGNIQSLILKVGKMLKVSTYLFNNCKKHPSPLTVATSAVYVTVILFIQIILLLHENEKRHNNHTMKSRL